MDKSNRRILVVDDDWTIWSSYELILAPEKNDSDSAYEQLKSVLQPVDTTHEINEDYVFSLSFASQGEEALVSVEDALKKEMPYSLAFIDVRMPPGWDGMETARRIRLIDPDIEIVIVTAYSDRSSLEITNSVGSPHKLLFFRKPFDPDELKQLAISLTDKYNITLKEKIQRKELEALLESSPTAIFTVDHTHILLSWNRAAEMITGYSAEEVLGKPFEIGSSSDNSSTFQQCFTEALDKSILDRQFEILCKDKKAKIISLNLTEIQGKTQKERRIIGSFWDITALKNSQTALSAANTALKNEIREKDQLQKKQLKLERKFNQARKMEAIGLMAGGVAHDLNNILTSIVSYPDVLLMDLEKDSPLYQGIKMIQKSGKRAAAVVSDLLTVARGVTVEKKFFPLNTLIQEYLDSPEGKMLQERYPEIDINTNLTSDSTVIFCSPIHITKCIMNLLHNAAEALTTFKKVEIETNITSLDDAGSEKLDLPKGQYVVLSIRDYGTGISPEDQERIFEPFYSKKTVGRSGTGLGLTVVWNTVLDHSGNIRVKSDQGRTEFNLFFPLSNELPAIVTDSEIECDVQGEGKILVVDDEEQQRIIVKQMLLRLGYSAKTVASGEEALEYIKNDSVDLVLLDMIMGPGMDGLRTFEEIVKICPDIKAVIISGYSAYSMVEKARELGIGEFISKPFSIDQLGLAIKKVLQSDSQESHAEQN